LGYVAIFCRYARKTETKRPPVRYSMLFKRSTGNEVIVLRFSALERRTAAKERITNNDSRITVWCCRWSPRFKTIGQRRSVIRRA
jgi:hypothetical protein